MADPRHGHDAAPLESWEQRRCTANGHRRYPSKRAAKGALGELRREGVPDSGLLAIYRCRECGSWHVGHGRRRLRLSAADVRVLRAAASDETVAHV